MEPAIRKATPGDIDAITALNSHLADYHHLIDPYYRPGSETASSFKENLSFFMQKENITVIVAETDKIIGYAIGVIESAKSFVTPDKIGKISHTFVEEKYRNQGIGKKMVDTLICWFSQKGIGYVELSVDSRNERGVKAWQHLGFNEYMKKMRLDLTSNNRKEPTRCRF